MNINLFFDRAVDIPLYLLILSETSNVISIDAKGVVTTNFDSTG